VGAERDGLGPLAGCGAMRQAGVCDNCGHVGPFAYVAGPPINGGLCATCTTINRRTLAAPPREPTCPGWCGTQEPTTHRIENRDCFHRDAGPWLLCFCSPACRDAGRCLNPASPATCTTCGGTRFIALDCQGVRTCPECTCQLCGGDGKGWERICPRCNGTGRPPTPVTPEPGKERP
jgi:hypothetical protein